MRPHVRPLGMALLAGGLLLPRDTSAQRAPAAEILPHDTVRVHWTGTGSRSRSGEGMVRSVGADSLVLETDGGRLPIARDAVTRVEFAHPRTDWEGFKRGFTVGVLALALPAAVTGHYACEGGSGEWGPNAGVVCAVLMGGLFGLGGGLVFGLVKASRPGVEWRDHPVRATAGRAPGGGASVGLSLSF